MHIVIGIISALLMLMILVFIHEGGHFMAAKAVGVKVNEFSIGMGPLLLQRTKGETKYSLRAVPIGGYVSMEGEDEESDDERAFSKKPWWAKALIVTAGPFMNFILAVIILAGLITYMGTSASNQVVGVIDGSPAKVAGITSGSTVLAVNGKDVSKKENAALLIAKAAEDKKIDSVYLLVNKGNGKSENISVKFMEGENNRRIIGINFKRYHNPLKGTLLSFRQSVEMEKQILVVLGNLITGKGSVKDVSGPVGLVTVVDKVARTGIFNMLYLTAVLSLNLGLINILPFPALDGGRLSFIIIRGITGKIITDEIEAKIHFAGIMILFLFMILITMNDVKNLIIH